MMTKAHARLSPSKAKRWMHCPGSVMLEPATDNATSYSEAGTKAHALAAALLTGVAVNTEGLDQETIDGVDFYVDFVRQLLQDTQGNLLVESKVPISAWTKEKDATGTADAIVYTDTDLWVIDLKMGKGVQVDAPKNPQIALYALGAMEITKEFIDIRTVHAVIVQPLIDHISQWDLSAKALAAYGKVIRNKATICRTQRLLPKEELVLAPRSDICQFCPAKASCPALQAIANEALDVEPVALTSEELGYWVDRSTVLKQFVSAIDDEAMRRLMAGDPVAGYKLVLGGSGKRTWTDSDAALNALRAIVGDAAVKSDVISVAQAEKLSKGKAAVMTKEQWAAIEPLVKLPERKPTIAREDDPRDTWQPEAANVNEFDVIAGAQA